MATAGPIVDDLRAESDCLDDLVAELPSAGWAKATPAPGWTVAHQIAHLLWTDRVALLSVNDEAGFTEVLGAAAEDPSGFVDRAAAEVAAWLLMLPIVLVPSPLLNWLVAAITRESPE